MEELNAATGTGAWRADLSGRIRCNASPTTSPDFGSCDKGTDRRSARSDVSSEPRSSSMFTITYTGGVICRKCMIWIMS